MGLPNRCYFIPVVLKRARSRAFYIFHIPY
jgi:hypothetical protein